MNGHFLLGDVNPVTYFLGLASLLGIVFASLMPDVEGSNIWVFVQWQLQTLLPVSILVLLHIKMRSISVYARSKPILQVLISGVLGCILFSPIALAIDITMLDDPTDELMISLLDEFASVLIPVTMCWFAMNLPFVFSRQLIVVENSSNETDSTTPQTSDISAFEKAIYPTRIDQILYLASELHYVRVVSEHKSQLILYSLAKAVEEIPHHIGTKVHRSFWVANHAVSDYEKNGRQGVVRLINGEKIPISRTNWQQIRTSAMESSG